MQQENFLRASRDLLLIVGVCILDAIQGSGVGYYNQKADTRRKVVRTICVLIIKCADDCSTQIGLMS